MRRLLGTVTAIALVAAVTAGSPALGSGAATAPAATPAASALHWGGCPTKEYSDLSGTRVRCAKLVVPMDYHHPHGRTVTLEVSRLRHTSSAADYKGVMFSNPGGPGAESLDLSLYLAPYVPHGVGHDYDWVTWDPRGVGASRPALHCESHYFRGPRPSYTPSSPHLVHRWLTRTKRYARSCGRKYPHLLDHLTTLDSARDMNSIRVALGVAKVSYFGYSYGTYLGQVYSTRYPSHLKYMVLDSNVDPRRVWWRANLDQDRAFERNIRLYFRWVAKHHRVFHLGTTRKSVGHRYRKDLHRLTRHPAGQLGGDEWADSVEQAAYYAFTWEDVAHAWQAFDRHGNTAPMRAQYVEEDTPNNDNGFAAYNAVQCTDAHWPTKWRTWRRVNSRYARKYPFMTWNNAWYNAPCLYWPGKVHRPVKIDGRHTKSVLLIDETKDAATPFEGSLEVRRLYPHASLLAEPGGTTHADSLDGNNCVDNTIATYLATGHRPHRRHGNRADATCRPTPPPSPAVARTRHG